MAITNQEFQDILTHIDELIKETIAQELHNLTPPPSQSAPQAVPAKEPVTEPHPVAEPPAALSLAPLDLAALRKTIQQAIKDEIAAQSKTLAVQTQEKPNPLAFYEIILKIRSTPNSSQNLLLPMTIPRPYFADVFNDVVSYFGGPNTIDPIGRRFLEEAGKRFAYLRADVWGQKDVTLFQQGGMIMFRTYPNRE